MWPTRLPTSSVERQRFYFGAASRQIRKTIDCGAYPRKADSPRRTARQATGAHRCPNHLRGAQREPISTLALTGRYRSGQTGQTVNLLALRLRWFESSPAQFFPIAVGWLIVSLRQET